MCEVAGVTAVGETAALKSVCETAGVMAVCEAAGVMQVKNSPLTERNLKQNRTRWTPSVNI